LLWAEADLRHALSNPTRRSRSAVGAPIGVPRTGRHVSVT